MSLFKFGKIAWPPKGAMRIPIAKSKSGIDCGHILVGIMDTKDPGAVGFKKPQASTRSVMEMVAIIPKSEKTDNTESGRNVNGVNTKKLSSLNRVVVHPVSSFPTRA